MSRLLYHSLAYLFLLVAVLSTMPLDSSFSSDDGAYGGQVAALRQGSWTLDRPLPVVAEEHEGWLNTAITSGGPRPYTTNPAYPVLLTTVVGVVHGEAIPGEQVADLAPGLHVIPVLSAVAAAAMAWLVAGRIHPPSAPLAFWLLALGPTLVNATTLWAHTLSTALGGLAVLAMLALTDRAGGAKAVAKAETSDGDTGGAQLSSRWPLWVAALAVALTGSAVVRTEALFWIGAVTLTALLWTGGWIRRFTIAVAGAGAGVVWLANRQWGAGLRADQLPIETSVEALNGAPSWLAGRLPAAWMLLINSPSGGVAPLFTLMAVSAIGAAVYRFHKPGDSTLRPGVLLVVAAGAYLARLVVAPGEPISGVLGAWPAMAAAVAMGATALGRPWARWRKEDSSTPFPGLWPVAMTAVLLTLCVLATQYASSGGLQWGGRYLSFMFVPLAVIAAVLGREVFANHHRPMLALVILPAVIGVAVSNSLHRHHGAAVAQASADRPAVVITESAALPRIAWRDLPVAYHRASEDDVEPLLAQLADAGVDVVNVHGLSGNDLEDVTEYRIIELDGPVRRLELATASTTDDVGG